MIPAVITSLHDHFETRIAKKKTERTTMKQRKDWFYHNNVSCHSPSYSLFLWLQICKTISAQVNVSVLLSLSSSSTSRLRRRQADSSVWSNRRSFLSSFFSFLLCVCMISRLLFHLPIIIIIIVFYRSTCVSVFICDSSLFFDGE
jgi:hypothetical protein